MIISAKSIILGNRCTGTFNSGKQRSKMRGTGAQRQFWGIGKIGNQDFDFGEQGNKAIYLRETREQTPQWQGLTIIHEDRCKRAQLRVCLLCHILVG